MPAHLDCGLLLFREGLFEIFTNLGKAGGFHPVKNHLSKQPNCQEFEISPVHQLVHQRCSTHLLPHYYQPTIPLYNLTFASINHCQISTYNPTYRTVDPKVEGSNPFGLVRKPLWVNDLQRLLLCGVTEKWAVRQSAPKSWCTEGENWTVGEPSD